MATVYEFYRGDHKDYSLRLTHEGRVLLTGGDVEPIVQRFSSEHEALAHVERLLAQRRRAGYRVEATAGPAGPAAAVPLELADLVQWDEPSQRVTLTFRADARARCDELLAFTAARAPRTLHVICDTTTPGPTFAQTLAAAPLPSVLNFVFDNPDATLTRQRGNSLGDLADLLAGLPALERAFLSGELLLRPCVHTSLRELYLLGDPLLPTTLAALGRSRLPALGRLGLALHHDHDANADRSAARALLALEVEVLTHVHVEGITDLTDFLSTLLERPLSTGWTTLDLNGGLADEDALLAALAQHTSLSRLVTLALPLADALSTDAEERARAQLRCLVDREELGDPFLPATYEPW